MVEWPVKVVAMEMLKDIDILLDKEKFRNLSRLRLEILATEARGKSLELP